MSESGGVSIARSRSGGGESRFYHPPAVRHRMRQQQQAAGAPARARVYRPRNASRSEKREESVASTTASVNSKSSDESEKRVDCKMTNLDRFLEFTTPRVQVQYLPKSSVRDWRTRGKEFRPYFLLEDLWDSFKEWSAYGAGVPLLLNGNESVVQYYVPYLSGMQLYIDPSKSTSRLRRPGQESDIDSSREASSDGSSDCGAERRATCIIGTRSQKHVIDRNMQSLNRLSLGTNPAMSSSSDESESCSPPGHLVFEYMERDSPYSREPLADKILMLASQYPELRSYRSCDLSPSSWISVAWYPIYRIPVGPTLQNLDACFLTFHSLSTAFNSGTSIDGQHNTASSIAYGHNVDYLKLSLPIFGLVYYKFRVSFWNSDGVHESQKASSLLKAADNWLKLLQVNHPDYKFFVSHNTYWK